MNLCSFTEQLWHFYLTEEWSEKAGVFLQTLDPNVIVIGTGKHEFYESRAVFEEALAREAQERSEIRFSIESITSREKVCSPDVRLVYGTLHLVGTVKKVNVIVDMSCRYSIVYAKEGDGGWRIVHVHQSIPNLDQRDGEYYPKTLVGQVQEAESRAQQMEQLARTDQLTGILNHQTFFDECDRLARNPGTFYCMVIDLDDFKQINDSYGHLEGDRVLQDMGRILQEAVADQGLAGRVGGDEFSLFLTKLSAPEEAEQMAAVLLAQVQKRKEQGPFPGISIGVAKLSQSESVRSGFRRADQMLYEVKRCGKNSYRVSREGWK